VIIRSWSYSRPDPACRQLGELGLPFERIVASIEETGIVWRLIEAALNRHDFIAGVDFTLCDISWGVHAHRWFGMDYRGLSRPELPALRAWYNRLGRRPACRTSVVTTPIA
jgi:glutathione S-transferase